MHPMDRPKTGAVRLPAPLLYYLFYKIMFYLFYKMMFSNMILIMTGHYNRMMRDYALGKINAWSRVRFQQIIWLGSTSSYKYYLLLGGALVKTIALWWSRL